MKPSDVVDLIADMEDAWREMTPGKKNLYARALADLDVDSTRRALDLLIKRREFLPSVAEIRQTERDARGVHPDVQDYGFERLALPGPDDPGPEGMTPEQQGRWDAVKAMLREKPIGRAYPVALDSVPDDDLKPKFILRRDMLCSGVGELAVRIDGVLCCPGCNEPIPQEPSEVNRMRKAIREAPRDVLIPKSRNRAASLPDSSSSSEGIRRP